MTNVWSQLLEFETRDLVQRHMTQRFNRKPSAAKIHQVTSSFIQGREYFRSAELASITVKPLLQYYGVMALSKGLILYLDSFQTEEQLKASHGLEIKNWKEVIKSKAFENLEITFGEGTFSELLKATGNRNLLRAKSSKINWNSIMKFPVKGEKILLKELINYYPDLHREYELWVNEKLIYEVVEEFQVQPPQDYIRLTGIIEAGILDKLFPPRYCLDREIDFNPMTNKTSIKYKPLDWGPNVSQLWNGAFEIGEACVIPTLHNDIGLNTLSGMYAMSYVFGMMARYYPTTWVSLRRVEAGDRIYPFALGILEFVHQKFPLVILDFLNSPPDKQDAFKLDKQK